MSFSSSSVRVSECRCKYQRAVARNTARFPGLKSAGRLAPLWRGSL